MKRYRCEIIGGILALAAVALPASAQTARVLVNNREVSFPDQQPVERDGRVYIPLRGVLERLGADTIQWRPSREEVFVARGSREIRLVIDDERAWVDGQSISLDAPPILVGGRTMVPLRFVSENLGATVRWDGYTRTAYLSVPQDRVAGTREELPRERYEDRPDDRSDTPSNDRDVRPRRNPRNSHEGNGDQAPMIRPLRPFPGEAVSSTRPEIAAVLRDRATGDIDYDSIRMRLDGDDVTRDVEIGVNSVTYRPPVDLESGRHLVRITVRDQDGNLTTREWSFRVR